MVSATRRHAREWAIQMLFQMDLNPSGNLDITIQRFWQQQNTAESEGAEERLNISPDVTKAPQKIKVFTEKLVRGVYNNREDIDSRLTNYTQNWPLHRMGGIERNVLRMAIYEMFYTNDAPPVVCINEAVDLAKYFSSAESGRFVNGILDRACRDVKRPSR